MTKSVTLVLGAGIGGLTVAGELRRRLGPEHRVVLFDQAGQHTFFPSLPWLVVGTRRWEDLYRPLGPLQAKGVEVVGARVVSVDPVRREVRAADRVWHGDYVVVALGAALAPEQVPGLADAGYNVYTLEGARALQERRREFRAGKLVLLVAGVPFKSPPTPYEIAMLLSYDCGKRGVRENVEVSLYTPEPMPTPAAGARVSEAICRLLERRRVGYYPRHRVAEVNPDSREIRFTNGARAQYDLLAYVAPHVVPPVVREAGLSNGMGWACVDRYTLETEYPGVYAVGDVTTVPLPIGMPLPKAEAFTQGQAEVVAHNIACAIMGTGQPRVFEGYGSYFIEVGGGRAAFSKGNFYAEPQPRVKLYRPGFHWHTAKVQWEKEWFRRWF